MSVKIIATDLDGTLMAPDHLTVTERTKNALYEAHKKGVKIAIATGRTLAFIDYVVNQIPFVDYIIHSNGAAVFDRKNNEYIYTNLVSPEITAEAITLLNSMPIYYNIYVGGNTYVQNGTEKYYINDGLPEAFIAEFSAKSKWCDNLGETVKGKGAELIDVFYNTDEQKIAVFSFFEENNIFMTSALAGVVSGTAMGSDKGTALGGLCKKLGILPDEAMTFGDASNDSTMLEFAKYSFAMENGDELCKKAAKNSAPSNADDGVAVIVEKYVLSEE